MDKALDDVDVRFYWDLAIGMTSIKIADDLLKMGIELCTTVCVNTLAKGFMEQYKQKNKKYTEIKVTVKEIVLLLYILYTSIYC